MAPDAEEPKVNGTAVEAKAGGLEGAEKAGRPEADDLVIGSEALLEDMATRARGP